VTKLATANQVNCVDTIGNVFALEDVTLNLGTTVSVSEIPYEQELARCQRYYEQFSLPLANMNAPVTGYCEFLNQVVMRASPTQAIVTAPVYSNASAFVPNGTFTTSSRWTWTITAAGSSLVYGGMVSLSARL